MSERAPAIRRSERCYWRLRKWMTPGLRNAQYDYFASLDHVLDAGDRWLDLGCGRRLAPAWMNNGTQIERQFIERASEVVGVDPDTDALRDNTLSIRKIKATAQRVPEPDASFDLITANMVFEHLSDPLAVLRESFRLLRPGGRVLIHTPNVLYPLTLAAACVPVPLRVRITSWLERRPTKDIYPTCYRMNRTAAVRKLADQAGLSVVEIKRIADSPETLGLGPLVGLELCLIAVTRIRAGASLASNLVITLEKPGVLVGQEDILPKQAQEQRSTLGVAA